MRDWRDRTTSVPALADGRMPPSSALDRRTVLMGLTTLVAAGLATRVRADDLSAEMILNDPDAPVGGNPNGDLSTSCC